MTPVLPPTPVSFIGQTTLLTLSGEDRPGVSRQLFGSLAALDVLILDVEQVVIRGQLILAVLVAPGPESAPDILEDAVARSLQTADRLSMHLSFEHGTSDQMSTAGSRVHVTLLGAPLRPNALAIIAAKTAANGGNIDRIERLAAYPVTALELEVSGADPNKLKHQLTQTAMDAGVDIAVQRSGLQRRAKRLVVMDVDSTLIQGEVIEMLAAHAGCEAEVRRITEAAMRGELDFTESLRARVALLAGTPASALDAVRSEITLAPGARTLVRTLHRLGVRIGVVSGGFSHVVDSLVEELGLDFSAANVLEIADGVLTGQLATPILDRAGKAAALRQFADEAGVTLSQTVAVGDGANDLDMLATAGLGVAFNAKPIVRQAADAALTVPYLDSVLFLLGITREEIDAADDLD